MNTSGSYSSEEACPSAESSYPSSMLSHHHHLSGLPSGSISTNKTPWVHYSYCSHQNSNIKVNTLLFNRHLATLPTSYLPLTGFWRQNTILALAKHPFLVILKHDYEQMCYLTVFYSQFTTCCRNFL